MISPQAPVVDSNGKITPVWFRWLSELRGSADASAPQSGVDAAIAAIATALGSPDGTVANIPQQDDATIRLLQGAGIAITGDAVNGYAIALRPLADSGTGALRGITRDSFGRVSGTTDAAITGTAGQIDVANGDAAAGPPTLSLADVADAGGGTLQKTAFDAKGRKTGSSAATASDVPIVDAGGYFTGTDVEAALQELAAGGGSSSSSDPTLQLIDPLYDFLAKPPTSTTAVTGASFPWMANYSATGSPSIASVDGGAAAPGVWRLATGTASSGRASLILGDLPNITLGAGLVRLPFRFRVPTLSDASNRFIAQAGFRDSWSSGVTNALFFSYSDNVNGGALVLEAWVGGVKTAVNGSTALTAGAWVSGVLEAAEDGSEARLYIGASVEATVSSGLPTGAMSVGAIMNKTVGTVPRNFDLDYLGPPEITFTTPR